MLRNTWFALAGAVILGGSALGQEAAETVASADEAIQHMLSERESPESLSQAIAAARKHGASAQAVLEAKFLYHVDRREDEKLVALLPALEEQAKVFKLAESEIFAVEEDWLAILEYVRAIKALETKDQAAFKKHITEAFWLSPQQGTAFAPYIERLRLTEAMKKVKVDFSLAFKGFEGSSLQLQSLVKERKALLLHFFSPWSPECENSLPDFAATAEALNEAGISVVTVLGESIPEAIADTRTLLESMPEIKSTWLIDQTEMPLAQTLRIQSAPSMVLVELDGSIKFNGHPSDPELWTKILAIAPEFNRPAVNPEGP